MGQEQSKTDEADNDGNPRRARTQIHCAQQLLNQMLARDCPLHMERPTVFDNRMIRSMHHFVLLKCTINEDGLLEAIIQHRGRSASDGSFVLFTATVTNHPYTIEELTKDIERGLFIVEHDIVDVEDVHYRAALTINQKGYKLGWYNCETYAEYLMTGNGHSFQTAEESSLGKDAALALAHEAQNLLADLIRSFTSTSGGSMYIVVQKSLAYLASAGGDEYASAAVKGLRTVVNFVVGKGSTWATVISRGALALGIVVAIAIEVYMLISENKEAELMNMTEEDRWKAVGENWAAFGGGLTAIVSSVVIGFTCTIPFGLIGAIALGAFSSLALRWLFRTSFRAYANRHHYYSMMRREALPRCIEFLKRFEKYKKVECKELHALVTENPEDLTK